MSHQNTNATAAVWLCTRPKLAATLMAQGMQCRQRVNPWCPDLRAWEFAITDELLRIVAAYYTEMDKPVPRALVKYYEGKQL